MNRLIAIASALASSILAATAQQPTTYHSSATGKDYEMLRDTKHADYEGLARSRREPSKRIYMEVNAYSDSCRAWIELEPFSERALWCIQLKEYAWAFDSWLKRNTDTERRRTYSHKLHSLDTLTVFFTYYDRDLGRMSLGRMSNSRVSVEFDIDERTGVSRMILYGSRLEDDHHNTATLPGWSIVFTEPRREVAELTEKLKGL